MSDILCVVCRHRPATRGHVCDADRDRITEQLADLPRKVAALTLQLVPTSVGIRSDRVSTTRTGSPTGARIDALTLLGEGSEQLSGESVAGMLHPQIRRWRTVHTVTVSVPVGDQVREFEREVVEWHQEMGRKPPYVPIHEVHTGGQLFLHESIRPVEGPPILDAADDQTGLLPPAEWLDTWVRAWRRHFGHSAPRLRGHGAGKDAASTRIAAGVTDLAAERHRAARIVLGLVDGNAGNRPADTRPDDPLADEWQVRWGTPAPAVAVRTNVAYLLAWFDFAAERDLGIADLAAELRSLTAELVRVLGETPDQQWLGRCPSTLTDRAAGTVRVCGAGLWHDPWASQVQCPRCRSTWGPRKVDLFILATTIRKVWPLDRRRRYTLAEADQALEAGALCPACRGPVHITWRDVTAAEDQEPRWRPERVTCITGGCTEAKGVI